MIAGNRTRHTWRAPVAAAGALFTPRLTCVARVSRVMCPVLRASAEALTLKGKPDFDTSGQPSLVVDTHKCERQ